MTLSVEPGLPPVKFAKERKLPLTELRASCEAQNEMHGEDLDDDFDQAEWQRNSDFTHTIESSAELPPILIPVYRTAR